jgi:regulatory protein
MAWTKRPPRTARNVMMDLLSRRDHSEKELRQKLKQKEFTSEDIDKALVYAFECNLIPEPQDLAERFAHFLHRQKKGHLSINQTLKKKGLPPVALDYDLEKEKALQALEIKLRGRELSELDRDQKGKLGRFLQARGYPLDVIRAVLYSKS